MIKKKVDKHAKKIDKLVTGLIIGGAVGSMIGLSKTKKGKIVTGNIKNKSKGAGKKAYSLFGKFMLFILKPFNKKK